MDTRGRANTGDRPAARWTRACATGAAWCALAAVIAVVSLPAGGRQDPAAAVMYAHFIDVGQADCTLLEFPCGAILIDAGSQDAAATARLIAYLDAFFDDRPDLDDTLDAVFITHNHIDHTRALATIADRYTIRHYVDNGFRDGMGGGGQRALVAEIDAGRPTRLREIRDAEISVLDSFDGLTDASIDPLECPHCDPEIHVLSASLAEDPGWSWGAFENMNNHSLVIRVDFGGSSFLFTGDLEEPAIETLVSYYEGTAALDVDVYQVGHHGSGNGTTDSLMEAMTPHAAVLSMGAWHFGRTATGGSRPFTTFAYGHPRRETIERLQAHIPGYRSRPITALVATGVRRFEDAIIRRRVYATGWDGDVRVRATLDRRYRVTTHSTEEESP
ncbi:MAG: MBL fold metallo-hydrolase [Phycisphaerales bacterium]|nr:MBL fold metallo-hydrolase [Phycisphaerales bacterium]